MRLILTTIILTMLAKPVWASSDELWLSDERCQNIKLFTDLHYRTAAAFSNQLRRASKRPMKKTI